MIPKIIHYIWLGKNPKSDLIQRCIRSWHLNLPDYQIVEWNEENFDITQNQYAHQAHLQKKWAFVSDYIRLKVLYEHGGVYLDTDVEVFRSLDDFLHHDVFTGFEKYEDQFSPVTAVIGSIPKHFWIKELLEEYEDLNFMSFETNTSKISKNLLNCHNAKNNNIYQDLNGIHIYPSTVFCEYSLNSYTQHHFNGSWTPIKFKILKLIKKNKFIKYLIKIIKK